VVVGVDRPVTLTAVGGQAALSADGLMICPTPPGASVSVRPHAHPLKLVRLDGSSFFERLRTHLFAPVARGVGRPSEHQSESSR
jgi:NAD kinase